MSSAQSLLTIIRHNHTKGWSASKAICERKFDGEQSLAFNCFPNCFLLSEIWGERRGWEIVSKLLLFIESEFLWNIFGANIILWSWNSEVKKSDRVSLFHLFTLLEEWSRRNSEHSVSQSGTPSSNMGAVQTSECRKAQSRWLYRSNIRFAKSFPITISDYYCGMGIL